MKTSNVYFIVEKIGVYEEVAVGHSFAAINMSILIFQVSVNY